MQVTYGCSHNTCAFCDMYKEKRFKLRPMDEILEDFRLARQTYRHVERVFLADGDALVRKASELYTILDTIRELFPECQRVTTYGSPSSIRLRTEEELRTLRDKGLTMIYMGLESGSDEVLKLMRKGHPAAEIIAMGQKVRSCGMALSVTAITGLGGQPLLEQHAIETAKAFNAMNPEYIGMADAGGGGGDASVRLGPRGNLPAADPGPGAGGNPAAGGEPGQPRQRVPDEPRLQLPDPEGDPEPGPARPAAAGAGGPHGSRPAAGELAGFVKKRTHPLYPTGYRGRGQLVKKRTKTFFDKGFASAARIICSLEANKFHTCRLRSIFARYTPRQK